jgi:HEXXH motif-containing protein
MIARHTLSETTLDELADGLGGPTAIRGLWRGQHSRRLLLLKLLIERTAPNPDRDDAVAAIIAAEHHDPTVHKLLVEPMVGVWAAATIRSIVGSGATAEQLGHLGALATAAALKAGTTSRLRGYSRGGWLYLPTIGRVRVPSGDGAVQLSTEKGRLLVDGAEVGPVDTRWQQRRELSVGHEPQLAICLEDVDPYRDAYHVAAADRLSPAEFDSWGRLLAETWRILTRYAPIRAAELAEGLHSLVPLQKPLANTAHSATAKEAVGVVGLDLPNSAADFAVALVHEFQHSKLTAVLDIVPLYDGKSDRTFFAPWRTDPRPIGGLLQGVYAFIAVADTWRALSRDPDAFPQAEHEFAEARAQVSDALDTLERSGLLTSNGIRFLAGMKRAVERLHAASVPAAADIAAHQVLVRRRTDWDRMNAAR